VQNVNRHPGAPHIDMRPSRFAKEQSLQGPGATHPLLAEFMLLWKRKTPIFSAGGLGVSLVQAQGPATACG
jgi:hypothetical protein